MKRGFAISSVLLLFVAGCGEEELNSLLPKPPDKVTISIDAPASGISWRERKIDCQDKDSPLCDDLSLLTQQLDFPKRAETLPKDLGDDYERLQEKAKFSKSFASTKGTTALPPGRSDTYSFPVSGAELTVMVSGSVAEVKNSLTSPAGDVYSAETENFSHEKTPYLERFIIPDPVSGTWTLRAANISPNKPVYSLTFETFVSRQKIKARGVSIRAEVLDDGEIVLQADGAGDSIYEWEMGDGFAGTGPVIGHNYAPGKYIPKLNLLLEGVGEAVVGAPFLVRKEREELPEVIAINRAGKKLPSAPRILSAKREGGNVVLRALAGSNNGGSRDLIYQYSLDEGGSWQDIRLLEDRFTIPFERGMEVSFRSRNGRGAGAAGTLLCNWSGYYPLEARARGIVDGEKINLYLRSGGCPGERWNIIAPLWKRAGIF